MNHPTLALIITLVVASGSLCRGQYSPDIAFRELESRLDAQAAEILDLRQRLDGREVAAGPARVTDEPSCGTAPTIRRLPLVVEEDWEPSCAASAGMDSQTLRFYADYDNGFVVRSFDPDKHPFQLKTNGWIQFRHHGFARQAEAWTDNAGITRPIRNRNAFDVERARLTLSGYALTEKLTYFLQLDGDTDGQHAVDFFDYWWAWEFTDRFKLQLGKRKVPASRQWLLGARRTRFIDRPMSNDFFRPDRSVGLFGVGRAGDSGHYEVMVGNGYQTSNLANSQTDDRFTFAMTNYFDPLGNFGGQLVDYDWVCAPLVRFGHSFVYSPQRSDALGVPLDETDFIRLTDGTRLTQTGALAPGVTVSDFDIYFYGLDFAMKWQGWSLNAEIFWRWIEELQGDAALPLTDLFQRGFYVEGGRFLVAKKLDWNLRYSQVSGLFGNASEYSAGVNWYPLDSAKMKISFDVSTFDGSPLQNTTTDILAGDDGILFRTQFQAEF